MEIIVRPARMEDYPAAERIMMQVQELHVGWRPDIYRKVDVALPKEELAEGVEQGTFCVAEADGNVAGILSFMYRHVRSPHQVERDVLYVDTMAVDEPYRGQGVGHAFFAYLKRLKVEQGLDGIELQVNARNLRAMEMYEKCGFTPKSVNMELLEQEEQTE